MLHQLFRKFLIVVTEMSYFEIKLFVIILLYFCNGPFEELKSIAESLQREQTMATSVKASYSVGSILSPFFDIIFFGDRATSEKVL